MIKEKQLELLGLSEKESRLYLSALELGSFSVLEIASKSGIKRPTCYILLEELTKRGLVSRILSDSKKPYKVEPPTVFIRQAKNSLKYAERIVPTLSTIFFDRDDRPKMKYHFGREGMRTIYEETLMTDSKEMCYVGSTETQIETVGEEFLNDYVQRRTAKGIKVKTVRMRRTQVENPLHNASKQMLREVRFAPEGIFIPDTICVVGNLVAVIFTERGNFGFIIESAEFSQSILGLFNALWQISTEN